MVWELTGETLLPSLPSWHFEALQVVDADNQVAFVPWETAKQMLREQVSGGKLVENKPRG